jgi:4-amino-4-deoxy-L-arabinose transferase-like glycosyltransferase
MKTRSRSHGMLAETQADLRHAPPIRQEPALPPSANGFFANLAPKRSQVVLALFLFCVAQSLMLGYEACRDSPTWDEVGHFAAGLSHWLNGRFDLYRVNPPLVRSMATAAAATKGERHAALLSLYDQNRDPRLRPEFLAGRQLSIAYGSGYFREIALARLICIPLSLLGGIVCFAWALELYGIGAAYIALALWAFSPSVLAYGHLITPDAGSSAIGLLATYLYWRWLKARTLHRAVIAGVALGLAELCKTTFVIFLLLWPVYWLADTVRRDRNTGIGASRARQLVQVVLMLVIAGWIINLGYCFERSFKRLKDYQFASVLLAGRGQPEGELGNRFSHSWFASVPIPLPENYILGVDAQRLDFERGLWSYLRGEWRHGGWWYYYLYAISIKEPLGLWALCASAAGSLLTKLARWRQSEEIVLLTPLVVIAIVSSQTGFNHHVRYILPALPFLFIFASRVGLLVGARRAWLKLALVFLLVAYIGSSVYAFPHSLSYYSEIVGGPRSGHYHLGNSNTDWGQDLLYLKHWLDEHPEASPLHLAYDVPVVDPSLAGISCLPLISRSEPVRTENATYIELGPREGWYAVSVNKLHDREGKYRFFLWAKPVGAAGYTILLYHFSAKEADELRTRLILETAP